MIEVKGKDPKNTLIVDAHRLSLIKSAKKCIANVGGQQVFEITPEEYSRLRSALNVDQEMTIFEADFSGTDTCDQFVRNLVETIAIDKSMNEDTVARHMGESLFRQYIDTLYDEQLAEMPAGEGPGVPAGPDGEPLSLKEMLGQMGLPPANLDDPGELKTTVQGFLKAMHELSGKDYEEVAQLVMKQLIGMFQEAEQAGEPEPSLGFDKEKQPDD